MENLKKNAVLLVFMVPGVLVGSALGALILGCCGLLAQKIYLNEKYSTLVRYGATSGLFVLGWVVYFVSASTLLNLIAAGL